MTDDVSSDIGQNLVWLCQSFRVKSGQKVIMSAGNGPMGYSIPSGIGSYFASGRPVVSFCGDGGFMMNVQELEFIRRERIPNKIICLNNHALGMIRSWQGRYLENYSQTTCDSGYGTPRLDKIADAFDLKYTLISNIKQLDSLLFEDDKAELIEVIVPTEIDTNPNGDMHAQSPRIDRELYQQIMTM